MAKYPQYECQKARKKSFSNSFPVRGITSLEFAEAGFYSIGVEDYTRCFFCGVGLRGWDNTDDPWKQHAKFSASCQYLIKKKGKKFISNLDNSNSSSYGGQSPKHCKDNISSSQNRKLTDKEIELHINARMDTDIVQLVLKYTEKLGFTEESLRNALKIQFINENDDFRTLESLIKNLMLSK